MRELGMVTDDVSKRHLKSATEYGSSPIETQEGDIIDLKTRAALPTFAIDKPTWSEWSNAEPEDVIDISLEDWKPQEHHWHRTCIYPEEHCSVPYQTELQAFPLSYVPSAPKTDFLFDWLRCCVRSR